MSRLYPSTIGDIGEAILITELKMRNYAVAIPFGHTDSFDLIVVNHKGRCLKVQVKTTSGRNTANCYRFYKLKDFHINDIYAFLMVDRWYFMTSAETKKLTTKSQTININISKISLDNFDLFEKFV